MNSDSVHRALNKERSKIFALTGGIGSGKSSVARIWREAGLPVVDADQVARAVVASGSDALSEIVELFGTHVLLPDGALDRGSLAKLIFKDAGLRSQLNGIVHPKIRISVEKEFNRLESEGAELICYEVPLLFETHQEERFRPVVVVSVPFELQLARTCARDHLTKTEVLARIGTQMPLAEKEERADHILFNEGTLEQLRVNALSLLEQLSR